MPDISNQMSYIQQLQDVRNPNSPMGALNQLAGSIGNVWQGYQGRTDEQDAIKFFMEKDVNPQTIQEFSSTHPQMPLMDVYKTAGTLATQKEAQSMKDMTKTLTNAISNGAQMDEKLIPSLFPNATPQQLGKFQTILTGMQQAGLNFKSLKEKDRFKPIGAQGLYDTETKGIIGQPAEKTTPLQDALKAKMLEVDPDTTEPYTAAKAYSLVAHPVVPKTKLLTPEEEAQQIRITQNRRPERLLTPEEEAQRIRIAKGGQSETPPIGNLRAVGINLAAKYFPLAKANMGADADKLSEGLFMTDQFGQNVNESRLRSYLKPDQQTAYDWIKIEAERLSKTETPAKAVDMALKAYTKQFPGGEKPPEVDTERQSAEAAITAGKDPIQVKAMYEKRTGKKY